MDQASETSIKLKSENNRKNYVTLCKYKCRVSIGQSLICQLKTRPDLWAFRQSRERLSRIPKVGQCGSR